MTLLGIVTVLTAYLIGSISFAVIFSRAFSKEDVRSKGSGNAGTTNVMRSVGLLPGILTFVCDALKGFVACKTGELIFQYIAENTDAVWAEPIYGAYICGVACMLGHIFPLFFGFKGGKGVATSVGIFLVCCPIAIATGLGVFALGLLLIRIVSLSSLMATVTVVVMSCIFTSDSAAKLPQIIMCVMMGIIVFVKHSANIKRLLKGEEKRFTVKRK